MSSVEAPQELLTDFAIFVDPKDNVAVVKKTHCLMPPGHRFATRDIPSGEFVIQFGQPIGTSLGIRRGEQITHDNMSDDVPMIRELPSDLHTPPPDYFPLDQRAMFMGYRRPNGRVGTRNHVLIVPTSMCASHEALQLSMIAEFTLYDRLKYPNVDGVVAIPPNRLYHSSLFFSAYLCVPLRLCG